MTVGFLYVEGHPTARLCAEGLVWSCKRVMPDVPVVQFTDETTAPIAGVDDVRRSPREALALMRFRHQAAVTGDWLFLDTDVLVQRDVRKVFRGTFHIAVTTRNWPHLHAATGFTERMPFNAGVIFSRSQGFWREAAKQLGKSETQDREFMGHQQVICDLVASGRYQVAQLKGSKYNCPPFVDTGKGGDPVKSDRMVEQAYIVHYKGDARKQLMIERIQREALCA